MIPGAANIKHRLRLRRLARQNGRVAAVIKQVRQKHLTYLEVPALCDLAEAALLNEANHVSGIIVEAGCALGGSAAVLASAKARERPAFFYDVFGMIPPPSSNDGADVHERFRVIASGAAPGIEGQRYYGYESDLYQRVIETLNAAGVDLVADNVSLVKGVYQESMHINSPVALAHIDCDWYDSVLTCLQQIVPNLTPGGTIIVDDYYVWSGCRKAVDDYFAAGSSDEFRFVKHSRLQIVRNSS